MKFQFYKYQGNGNDFVLIDGVTSGLNDSDFTSEHVTKICDRKFGIGADGFIVVEKEAGKFKIVYRNSDGADSSLCGNGTRCFIHHICTILNAPSKGIIIASDGEHHYEYTSELEVGIEMFVNSPFQVLPNGDFQVNTGSPHYLKISKQKVSQIDDFHSKAQAIRNSPPYRKEGINVNLVEIRNPKEVNMRTYERGVEGETLACGTGMTAAAIMMLYQNKVQLWDEYTIHMPGGTCECRFDGLKLVDDEPVWERLWMIGPSQLVFSGMISV